MLQRLSLKEDTNMIKRIIVAFATFATFLIVTVTSCNAQTQYNSTGDWTEFKNVETNVQARCRCAQGGPWHGRYVIQFKNSNANQIKLQYQVTGNVYTTPKQSLII